MTTEQQQAAATRRRWINIGEIVAVIAVIISALTLWNSYKERNADEADRAAEKADRARDKAEQGKTSQILSLKASGGGATLVLAPRNPDQTIQSATITFPSQLGVARIDTVSDLRIEGGWIKQALKQAREAKKAAKGPGDARMPVAITTRFTSGDEQRIDTSIYDVGYRASGGGLFGGTEVTLRGLSLVERVGTRTAQARLDALWKARNPS